MLDERKRLVLRAIVDSYIETAEPVGSRTIARRHDLGVSPATIRNEMADLEEIGYLEQPHVSAGRIPSDKGYRFYVDALMEPRPIPDEDVEKVERQLLDPQLTPERALQAAAKLLSLLTESVSLVVAPSTDQLVFKHVQLVCLEPSSILVTLVLHPMIVKSRLIRTQKEYSPEAVGEISDALNRKLKGITYRQLGATVLNEIISEFGEIGRALVELVLQSLVEEKEEQIYATGASSILSQPEFRDVQRAAALFEALEKKDVLLSVLGSAAKSSGVKVIIGQENTYAPMQACSIVTCTYYVGGDVVGALGVLGPTRMDYAKMVAAVDLVAQTVSMLLSRQHR